MFPIRARGESLGRYFSRCHQLFSRKFPVKQLAIQNIALLVILSLVNFIFSKFSKKVVAEVLKIPNFSEISNRIAEFKLEIAIHYTIEPIEKTTKRVSNPRLKSPMDFQSIALTTWPFCLQKLYQNCISICKFSIDKLHLLGILQISIIKKNFTWSCQDFLL